MVEMEFVSASWDSRILFTEVNHETHMIAKEFDVKEEQVVVAVGKVYSGYGIGEYKDYEIYATVNMR